MGIALVGGHIKFARRLMYGTVNPRPPQLAASFISNQACDVAYWHGDRAGLARQKIAVAQKDWV